MEDISPNFVTELKGEQFQQILKQFKDQKIKHDGKETDGDLFLIEKIFPVVLEGLERLSQEVEEYLKSPSELNLEDRKRFNPCIFLGQYLMRHNPKYNEEIKNSPQFKMIQQYAVMEKYNRLFTEKKTQFIQFFYESTKKSTPECELADIRIFAEKLDQKTNQNGKLKDFLLLNKTLNKKSKQLIKFDAILEQVVKYCSQNESISQNDFSSILK
ncbi:hypothetical protein PPERSA_08868 [Pseudocohnilembus persalinus]|uniref:Uncharacterized protein n=1 Tax=Pseudocohnilembus persalinus TaxID=266149 RepID=A0A0V0R467_PSEPJ|nr:hypothetical protein PPERSA_08868 [Pseudocohnilembus persalinus]|eukprot:KRX09152.1 hypothetical protein PPERSA_08868 [Pseudocohnilembus persalinus]